MPVREAFLSYAYPFSIFILLEAQNVALLARAETSRAKSLSFFSVLASWAYLTCFVSSNDAFFDNAIGCNATNLLLVSFRLLIVEPNTRTNAKPILDSASGWQRVKWAYKTRTSARGSENYKDKCKPTDLQRKRDSFVRERLLWLILSFLGLDILNEITHLYNPYFTDPNYMLSRAPWPWKLTGLLHTGMVYCGLNCMYHPWAIISVATGASEPREWPYLFGNLKEAYTVHNCWSRVWHQIMRKHLKENSAFMTKDLLRLDRSTQTVQYLEILIAFLLSGFLHAVGESMAQQHISLGALTFFALQPLALVTESAVLAITSKLTRHRGLSTPSQPNMALKTLGYLWVLFWMSSTLPFWLEPLMQAGFMTSYSNIPRGVTRTLLHSLISIIT
ncbi:hypothetical protein FA15DRAFT_45388 [Coprinopsis marcescibilis]|uniref:Wax synthase domain-containing protein n=1 Tax=Coprinopsis marcescibilis TaxID=230819 RepID=A0A5C3KPE6_COPMA|nr:hypothetical protein FA15DRAFT_45388 [Coprinopsis marcescibilis]